MFSRDILKIPTRITREKFVNIVFEIGYRWSHSYNTIITAVMLGDEYIDKIQYKIFNYYSIELAYVVSILSTKLLEDFGYCSTSKACYDVGNRYIIEMEWNVFTTTGYNIRRYNYIDAIPKLINGNSVKQLNGCFFDISRDICMDKQILNINPFTLILGLTMLYRKNKLLSYKKYKKRIFYGIMRKLSKEYEVDLSDILSAYIKIKQK